MILQYFGETFKVYLNLTTTMMDHFQGVFLLNKARTGPTLVCGQILNRCASQKFTPEVKKTFFLVLLG